ncbi:Arginine/serine-rich splicing factor scl25a transcript I [Orobanche minor]
MQNFEMKLRLHSSDLRGFEFVQFVDPDDTTEAKHLLSGQIFILRAGKKQPDPDRKLFFAEVFAKTRKHKPGRIYKFNLDVMQVRIDTIKYIGEICAIISSYTGGDGTPMTEGPSS